MNRLICKKQRRLSMDNEYEKIDSIYAEMNEVEREIGIVVSFSGGCVVITGFTEIIVNEKTIYSFNKVHTYHTNGRYVV